MQSSTIKWVKKAFDKKKVPFLDPNWQYQIPETLNPNLSSSQKQKNARQRVYDFYFFESIDPDLLKKSEAFELPETKEEVEIVMNNLRNAKKSLIDSMKGDYVEDLRFSISCELRHVWDGHCKLPKKWLDSRVKTALEIENVDEETISFEIDNVLQAISNLEKIDIKDYPEFAKTKKLQIKSLQDHLSSLESKKEGREASVKQYFDSFKQRFIISKEHGWSVAKTASEGEGGQQWKKDWKIQQLDQMARFILSGTSKEWATIQKKVDKYLESTGVSGFKFGDFRDIRYTWSGGESKASSSYFTAYKKAYKAGFSNRELALLATAAFLDGKWTGAFGGPNWAVIAKTFASIDELVQGVGDSSKMLGERSSEIAIDQAHNLQHNTSSAFNKASIIYGNGGFFEDVLNFKASSSTTQEKLLEKSSDQLKEVGQYYLDHSGNPPSAIKNRVFELNTILTTQSKIGKLCDFLQNQKFNIKDIQCLSYVEPIDWICLARNRHFDKAERDEFWRSIRNNFRFGRNFQKESDLDPVYEAYYSNQNFADEEIEEIMNGIDLPSMDKQFQNILNKPELFSQELEASSTNKYNSLVKTAAKIDLGEWLSPKEQEEFEKNKTLWLSEVPGFSKQIQDVVKQYKNRDLVLKSLAKNPHLPIDFLFRIFSIANEAAGTFSPTIYDAIYFLSKNPTVAKEDPNNIHVGALKELIDNYEFPDGFLEEKEKEKEKEEKVAIDIVADVQWDESEKLITVANLAKFINLMKSTVVSSTNAIVRPSLPKPYSHKKYNKKLKRWEIDFLINKVEVARIDIDQSHDTFKLTISGKQQLLPIDGDSVDKIVELLKKIEMGESIDIGPGQSAVLSDDTKTIISSNFKKIVDEWIENFVESINQTTLAKILPSPVQFETTMVIADQNTGDESVTYAIKTPNVIFVTITLQGNINLYKIKLQSTLLKNEYSGSFALFDQIKKQCLTFVLQCNDLLITKALLTMVKTIPGLSIEKDDNSLSWRFGFSGKNTFKQLAEVTLKNSVFYFNSGLIHKEFGILNATVLGIMKLVIVEQLNTEGIGLFVDKSKYEDIVGQVSNNISGIIPNNVIGVTGTKFRLMVGSHNNELTNELSKITFYDTYVEVKVYSIDGISEKKSPVSISLADPDLVGLMTQAVKNGLLLKQPFDSSGYTFFDYSTTIINVVKSEINDLMPSTSCDYEQLQSDMTLKKYMLYPYGKNVNPFSKFLIHFRKEKYQIFDKTKGTDFTYAANYSAFTGKNSINSLAHSIFLILKSRIEEHEKIKEKKEAVPGESFSLQSPGVNKQINNQLVKIRNQTSTIIDKQVGYYLIINKKNEVAYRFYFLDIDEMGHATKHVFAVISFLENKIHLQMKKNYLFYAVSELPYVFHLGTPGYSFGNLDIIIDKIIASIKHLYVGVDNAKKSTPVNTTDIFSAAYWNVDAGDPWILTLQTMKEVHSGLMSEYTLDSDGNTSTGILRIIVKSDGIEIARINAYKKLNKIKVDTVEGSKQYQVSFSADIYGIYNSIISDVTA